MNNQESLDDNRRDPTTAMFSAASFVSIVGGDAQSGTPAAPPAEPPPLTGAPVVAFYGYRGGAGRTTALAWYAEHLCSKGMTVVAIDLDIEAPGLASVFDCLPLDAGLGSLSLLRKVEQSDGDAAIDVKQHLVASRNEKLATLHVLPAGVLDDQYLVDLDDLGVGLWHTDEAGSPIGRIIAALRRDIDPEAILLDCRTGLSGLSASAAFHTSDVVVNVFTATKQSLDGIDVFLRAARAARQQREGRPSLLLVPSMIGGDPESQARLSEEILPAVDRLFSATIGEDVEPPVLRQGIPHSADVAVCDGVQASATFAERLYGDLFRDLDVLVINERKSARPAAGDAPLDVVTVLRELRDAGLSTLAFAEDVEEAEINDLFVIPRQYDAIRQPKTAYVVGSKGAGKTWLWQHFASLKTLNIKGIGDATFVPVFGPKSSVFPKELVAAVYRDQKAAPERLVWFWRLACLWSTLRNRHPLRAAVVEGLPEEAQKRLGAIFDMAETDVGTTIRDLLREEPEAGLWADRAVRALDAALSGEPALVWIFDGLDTGFEYGPQQSAFATALISALEEYRNKLKKVYFKVFIREDLYLGLTLQNRSHLEGARAHLKWEAADIWGLTLNLAAKSREYSRHLSEISPLHCRPGDWPITEEDRRALLDPLWGAQMERGNKVSTANFVQRRTTDGQGRLLPRTLVQLLAFAVEGAPEPKDRVLRAAAILDGYKRASEQRVQDLRTEYLALAPYLAALDRAPATGTAEALRHRWRKISGVADPIKLLVEIGVLAEYKRARGEKGELKYEISLLYRPGLGVKLSGV